LLEEQPMTAVADDSKRTITGSARGATHARMPLGLRFVQDSLWRMIFLVALGTVSLLLGGETYDLGRMLANP
jgi:hypothetical protein